MSKEGGSAFQFELFASHPPKPTSSEQREEATATTIEGAFKEKREARTPTLREVRAVSSLLRNRLQLEVVERRIKKTTDIIISYLLTQDSLSAQIGPYLVWLNENNDIEALRTLSDDDWQQLYLPEIKS